MDNPSRITILSEDMRALTRRGHSADSKERYFLMMDTRAYCDESYNNRIYTVTGYLATGAEWESLTEDWALALEEEEVPFAKNSKYRVFHANEVEGGYGPFEGMTRDDRDRIQKRFGVVIRNRSIFGFASAIVLEHYDVFKPRIKQSEEAFIILTLWPFSTP